MTCARQVFDHFPDPEIALWNATFRGYAQNDSYREAVALFWKMKAKEVLPNGFTFPIVIKSCTKINAFLEGEEVHCEVVKLGFRANQFVGTALIDFYVGKGDIKAAYKVFVEMPERNVVTWTSIVNAYISCNDLISARRLFDLAPERDIVLWNTMVSGYIVMDHMGSARDLFDKMPNKDVMSWNTVLNGYAKNGDLESCQNLFEEMPQKNIFSWNGLIGGYARKEQFLEVLGFFKRMLTEENNNVVPNDATLVTVLSACARLGALDLGKWVHVYAWNNGYKGNVFVGNALVDMYAKCGTIGNSVHVFKSMERKDLVTWNTIICGLAMHGHMNKALEFFHKMKKAGEKPDGITFVGILCACMHLGSVKDGILYFRSMIDDYSIKPHIEHYGCMVDLLGRAGLLDQAIEFVNKMPIEADAVIWAGLLGSCRIYKNIELAELALKKLTELEPKNPSNFVMLSNIYGDLGRWKDAARLKVAMRDTGFRKLPGCSLIEVNDDVVEFYSLDERHSDSKEIYEALMGLTNVLRSSLYDLDMLEL